MSSCNYGAGDSNPRDLSLSPSNAPFRNYIPSVTLSLLMARYTARSRNGKLYLSSGTGPRKLETDDVRVNLSRMSLCCFWIVKPPPRRRHVWWLRVNKLWNTGNKNSLHLRPDADTFLYAWRVAAECCVLVYRPRDVCQKDLRRYKFLGNRSKVCEINSANKT